MYYDYRKEMIQDIKNYIWMNDLQPEEGMSRDKYLEYLNDELWDKDEVTGNGANYYGTEEECEEYICHNLKLFFEALSEWGMSLNDLPSTLYEEPARYMDSTIRCYLLNECISKIFSREEEK